MVIFDEMGSTLETMLSRSASDCSQNRPTVRFYQSATCGASHIVRPVVDSLAKAYRGSVRVERRDVHDAVAVEDGVERTPTLVFIAGDVVVDWIVGPTSRARIAEAFAGVVRSAGYGNGESKIRRLA